METLTFNLFEDGEQVAQEKWEWDESFNTYRIWIRYFTEFGNRHFEESNVACLIYKRELVEE